MNKLRQKMVRGFTWSAISVFGRQVLSFLIHLTLARILIPEDFGIIGMISIFMELALRLQGAGLGEALIRKKEVSQAEYNFVFFYGLLISSICYAVLFLTAPIIANFYAEPRLIWIIRILTLNLILIPMKGINRTQLIKKMNFNIIAKVEISAGIGSGICAIALAYNGYGVWSLVFQNIIQHILSFILLLKFNWWLPTLHLHIKKSKKLFAFGSRLMLSNFIETGFKNIYNVIIGKQYSAASLGFYTQGLKLQKLPANAVNSVIKIVSFPVFADIKENKKRYKSTFRKTMRLLTYINFPVLIALAAIADPLIPFVFSEKWRPTIPFFQLLIAIGMLEPMKSLFINILKVEGKADILIRYIIFTKLFYIVGIGITLKFGLHALVLSQITATFFELLIFSRIGRYINYSLISFFKDILPNLSIAALLGFILVLFNRAGIFSNMITLFMDLLICMSVFISVSYFTNNATFIEIKKEVLNKTKILE